MNPWFNKSSLPAETSAAPLLETVAQQQQNVLNENHGELELNTLGICYPSKIEVIALLKRVFRMEERAARQAQLLGNSTM